ncbi:ATP-dependent DNA ligase, partial [Streptomyces sp. SID10244]|nr:ATP-dependent DNA ligase [Streptomyces sp. SID10244]
MKLSRVVEASSAVTATRSRKKKTEELGALLGDASVDEIPTVVAWLSGVIPQGRLGVGWRSLVALELPPATDPTLTVAGV